MTNEEIRRLVMEATAKVKSASQDVAADVSRGGASLVLLSEHSAFPKEAFFRSLAGSAQIIVAGFGACASVNYQYWNLNDQNSVSRLLESLDSFGAVYLYAPGFSEMARLAKLEDDSLVARALLQRLFSGKVAGICFDHDPAISPKLKSRLGEALAPLEALGFSIHCGGPSPAAAPKEADKRVILEEDVLGLHRQGQTSLHMGEGAILTPLAADKARELGIEIRR